MPKTDKGEKIYRAMQEEYGPEKGKEVFYASRNKGTITGVDNMRARDQGAPVTGQIPQMPPNSQQPPVTGDDDVEGPKGVLKPIGELPEEKSIAQTKAGGPSGTPDAEMVGSPDKVGHRRLANDRPPDKQIGTLKDYAAAAGAKR